MDHCRRDVHLDLWSLARWRKREQSIVSECDFPLLSRSSRMPILIEPIRIDSNATEQFVFESTVSLTTSARFIFYRFRSNRLRPFDTSVGWRQKYSYLCHYLSAAQREREGEREIN